MRAVSDLDDASREVLEEALQKAYRIERIVRVLKVEKEVLSGQARWLVEIATEKNANLNAEDDENDSDIPTENDGASQNGAATTSGKSAPFSDGDGAASTREPKLLRVFSDKDKDDDAPGVIEKIKRKRRANSADDQTLFGGLSVSESEERQFLIGGQEDVQTARYPHIFIVDTDRNRYEILDCEALDLESRRAAERFF